MRMNKEIQKLTEAATDVEWPKPNHPTFTRFESALCELMRANDLPARGIDFDEYNCHFYWEETYSAAINGLACSVHHTYYIDPRKPIADEFNRVLAERKAIASGCIELERSRYAREAAAMAKAEELAAAGKNPRCTVCERPIAFYDGKGWGHEEEAMDENHAPERPTVKP